MPFSAQYYNGSDSDGDGVITNCPAPGPGEECAGDADSDGIPDYLDNDSLDNAQTAKTGLIDTHPPGRRGDVSDRAAQRGRGERSLPQSAMTCPCPYKVLTAIPTATQISNTLVWVSLPVPAGGSITLTLVAQAPLSTTTLYTVTNRFVGSLPAEFLFNQIPERVAPVLTVAPYIYYMPVVRMSPLG